MKRCFDLIVAGLGLVVSSPVWLVVGVAIKLTSRGPAIHKATRVGRHGVPFVLYKFRTMKLDAAARGPGVTGENDPRVTEVGRFLRRWKFDELPQLVNVLRGDMSIVGPRPEDPRYVATYDDDQRLVLEARPGLTSPAVLAYRNETSMLGGAGDDPEKTYVEEVLPGKLALDLEYVRSRSLGRDLQVIIRTLLLVTARGGWDRDGSR